MISINNTFIYKTEITFVTFSDTAIDFHFTGGSKYGQYKTFHITEDTKALERNNHITKTQAAKIIDWYENRIKDGEAF